MFRKGSSANLSCTPTNASSAREKNKAANAHHAMGPWIFVYLFRAGTGGRAERNACSNALGTSSAASSSVLLLQFRAA
eukprot:12641365-Heterocapsa_arctica.AAC.1